MSIKVADIIQFKSIATVPEVEENVIHNKFVVTNNRGSTIKATCLVCGETDNRFNRWEVEIITKS